MASDSDFESIWNTYTTFAKPEKLSNRCTLAKKFYKWALPLVGEALENPTTISINQTKLQLINRLMAFRAVASRAHRFNMNPTSNHICLWHVFEQLFEQLEIAELELTPPQFFVPMQTPTLPPPPPTPSYDGILLGEALGEEY